MKFIKLILMSLIFNSSYVLKPNNECRIDTSKFVENPRIFFVDIGETLIEVNKLKSFFKHLGFGDTIAHTFKFIFKGKLNVKKETVDNYLEILNKIPSGFEAPNYEIKGFNGATMPPLQRDSFLGKISLKECVEIGDKWIDENFDVFKNETQRRVLEKCFI